MAEFAVARPRRRAPVVQPLHPIVIFVDGAGHYMCGNEHGAPIDERMLVGEESRISARTGD